MAVAQRLPRGAGVIYRSFGRPNAEIVGQALAKAARARGLVLLVGLDARLAAKIGAHGVHLPERALHLASRLKRQRPKWLITGAAHGVPALQRAARFGFDAVLVSPVFASNSASAGRPLGVTRFAALARASATPVYALGGVRGRNGRRLHDSGAVGLAAVEGIDNMSEI